MNSADDSRPINYQRPTPGRRQDGLPIRAGTLGMALFLASLGMLFVTSLLGYILIRTAGKMSPPLGTIHIPLGLYFSTLIVVLGSVTVHLAVSAVRRERQADLRQWLLASLILALLFVAVQAIFLKELLQQHFASRAHNIQLYGLIFFLILLHGLHVVGGVISLSLVYKQAREGAYDHEKYTGVSHAAAYWHFLDGVWLTMFVLFLALR